VDTVIHNISPWLLTVVMLPSGSITEEQYDDAFGRSVKGAALHGAEGAAAAGAGETNLWRDAIFRNRNE
jgi:hypothetical protein